MSDHTSLAEAGPTAPARPLITITAGHPDDTQVAALTVLFSSLVAKAQAEAQQKTRNRNMWGHPEERLRQPLTYNPTAFHNVSFY